MSVSPTEVPSADGTDCAQLGQAAVCSHTQKKCEWVANVRKLLHLCWWLPRWGRAAGCSNPPAECNGPDVSGSTGFSPLPGNGRHRWDSLNLRCSSAHETAEHRQWWRHRHRVRQPIDPVLLQKSRVIVSLSQSNEQFWRSVKTIEGSFMFSWVENCQNEFKARDTNFDIDKYSGCMLSAEGEGFSLSRGRIFLLPEML